MQIFQLRAFDLLCLHIYFILFIQLFFNWQQYNCDTNISIILMFMYLLYIIRVIIAQLRRISFSYSATEQKERLLSRHATVPCTIQILNYIKYSTEVILVGINIFFIVILEEYKKKFENQSCESRDVIVLFITINFIVCIKSIVNVVIEYRKRKQEVDSG